MLPLPDTLNELANSSGAQSQRRLYFPQIDGLRFLAFLLVLIHHYKSANTAFPARSWLTQLLARIGLFGWVGVDIFLVLSSFLIFTLLLEERKQTGSVCIKKFYIRRALRIWPLYFPFILFAMFVAPYFNGTQATIGNTAYHHLLTYMTFTGNFSYALFNDSISFFSAPLWTISLEEQFYAFAPFIIYFGSSLRGNAVKLALGLLTLSMVFRWYVLVNAIAYPMVYVNPLCRLDPFIIGALCAYTLHKNPDIVHSNKGWLWVLISFTCYALVVCFPQIGTTKHTIWQLFIDSVGAGCLVMAVLCNRSLASLFSWKFLPFLGKISFGLYVYHFALLYVADAVHLPAMISQLTPLGWTLKLILVLLVTITVSSVSYLCYERKFLRFKERFEQVKARQA